MEQPQRLFRSASLERLSTPEQLDQLMQVTDARAWLAAAATLLILAAAGLWGFFGTIPDIVNGQGLLIRGDSVHQVQAPASGQLTRLDVKVGDEIAAGQVVAQIRAPGQAVSVGARSTEAGLVTEIGVEPGAFVQTGTALVSLEREDLPLNAILYVPADSGKRIAVGMDVQVAPTTVRKEDYGQLIGRVTYVSSFPVSSQAIQSELGSPDLAKQFAQSGSPVEVHVALTSDPTTPSGYRWTSQHGPPRDIVSGTLAQATFTVDQQRPINLIYAKITGAS